MNNKITILLIFLFVEQYSSQAGNGLVQAPPLVALQEEDVSLKNAPVAPEQAPAPPPSPPLGLSSTPAPLPLLPTLPLNLAPAVTLLPIPPPQPAAPRPAELPIAPLMDNLVLTEHHVDFAALYSIIRYNIDLIRAEIFLKLFCKKGICIYPELPIILSRTTKYYVTAKKNFSILVTITLSPRELLQDRIMYQADLDNIIVSQLTRQLAHLEHSLLCFKRVCLVPLEPFKGSEHNMYCNYQDLTEACTFVTFNVIMNYESDFDNSLKINRGEAGNVAISSII